MNYQIDGQYLTDIADAIRAKTGGATSITPEDMPDEIASISGGGAGNVLIPSAIQYQPYSENNATGYVGSGNWCAYDSNYAECRTDIYKITATNTVRRYFLIFIASSGDNRFRLAVLTTDPTSIPQGSPSVIYGQNAIESRGAASISNNNYGITMDTNPKWVGGIYGIDVTADTYICVGKTNQDVNNVKSYLVEITNAL